MTAPHIVDPTGLLGEALSEASPDLMRNLLQTVINALLSADADAVVGAEWGRPAPERVTQRNGYRHRDLDTRIGGEQRVDNRLQQTAHKIRGGFGQGFTEQAGGVDNVRSGHRDDVLSRVL